MGNLLTALRPQNHSNHTAQHLKCVFDRLLSLPLALHNHGRGVAPSLCKFKGTHAQHRNSCSGGHPNPKSTVGETCRDDRTLKKETLK